MEDFISKYLSLSAGVFFIFCCLLNVFHAIWWKPKSLEKQLKKLGIGGNSYELLYGDLKEMMKLREESLSKPIPLNHAIVHRVNPLWPWMLQKYGKISFHWLQRRLMLIVADPVLMRSILNNKSGHFRRPTVNPLVDILSSGINALDGENWAKRRKLIAPAFHHEKLRGMVPAFLTSCCGLIDKWKNLIGSKESFELDIAQEMQELTADVISRAAFGSNFEEGRKIFELQKEQAALAFEAAKSIYLPGFRFLPTKKNKRRYEIDNKIKAMLREIIERKERAMQSGESEHEDLLSLLLQCQFNSDNEFKTEDVIEECKFFYFAGQETTANWLTWTLIVLSMHPNWQEKATEEVLKICGKKTPHLRDINLLKIVWMVLQEVLRLYPALAAQRRYMVKATELGGMLIPAGVDVVLPTLLLHHDPAYWGEDADEFKPERFSEGTSKASKDQLAYYPFGWGPRICLGQNFAMMEAKMALAMILQNFSFELSPSYTHAPYSRITLQPQHGSPIIFRKL